jgi:hypothetical protein
MSELGDLIKLPDGTRVYYRDEDHSYWRCKDDDSRGKRLTGVTTAVSPFDFRADRLLTWAAKTQCIGIAELAGPILAGEPEEVVEQLAWLTSQEEIWHELEDSELTFEHVRDRAGKRGTNVHELAFRALAMGKPVPDFEKLSEEERGYARAVVQFWLDHEPDALQVEQVVADTELGVAGRFDFRGTLATREGIGLIDAKTGGFIPTKAHAQLGAYDKLATDCGFGPSDWQAILQLSEDGTYRLIPVQATHKSFELALELYRENARIQGAATKEWKKAQKEREAEAVPA